MIARLAKRFRDWLAANDSTPPPDHRPIRAAAVGVQRLPDGGCYLVIVGGHLKSEIFQLDRQARASLMADLKDGHRAEMFAPTMAPYMG